MTKQRWRTLPGTPDGCDYADVGFVELDLGDASSLSNALAGCDLVVHTAGPFQRKTTPEVLEAAIKAKVRPRAHCRRVFGSMYVVARACAGLPPCVARLTVLRRSTVSKGSACVGSVRGRSFFARVRQHVGSGTLSTRQAHPWKVLDRHVGVSRDRNAHI